MEKLHQIAQREGCTLESALENAVQRSVTHQNSDLDAPIGAMISASYSHRGFVRASRAAKNLALRKEVQKLLDINA